jgi:hypothetical protein
MSPAAAIALKAAGLRTTCGRYAANQYAMKHGVFSLYRLALQLGAATKEGF